MSDMMNFSIVPQNPIPGMMQSLQMGTAIGGMMDQRAQAEAAARQAEAAAREKAARDAQLSEMFKLVHDNPSAENYAKLANFLPKEQADSIRASFKMLTEDKQQTLLNESAQVFSALKSGNKDIALDMLRQRAEAYRNSGNDQGVKQTQMLIDLAGTGDKGLQAVEDFFGMNIAQMPGGKDAIDAVAKLNDEQRAEQLQPLEMEKTLADIGLTKAQTNKILTELRAMEKSGGMDPEKLFNFELTLNKEYAARTKNYEESLRVNDIIKASAADSSGAGDLALITAFNKMLDPAGVVRESDFAMAQDTGGLMAKLAASLGRVQNGEVLRPEQRADFARLANEYMNAAIEHEERVRKNLGFIVDNYGMNRENVFGTMANKPEPGAASPAATSANLAAMKALALRRFPDEADRINAITSEDAFRAEYKRTYDMWLSGQGGATTGTQPEPVRGGSF